MKEYRILKTIKLSPRHKMTGGRTIHHAYGEYVNSKIDELKIMKFDGEEGYYLLYYDADGKELNDTFHDTVEMAMSQAQFEFNVLPEEWQGKEGKEKEGDSPQLGTDK